MGCPSWHARAPGGLLAQPGRERTGAVPPGDPNSVYLACPENSRDQYSAQQALACRTEAACDPRKRCDEGFARVPSDTFRPGSAALAAVFNALPSVEALFRDPTRGYSSQW